MRRKRPILGYAAAIAFSLAAWALLACVVMAATRSEERLLERVNQAVNQEMTFQPDDDQYGRDRVVIDPPSRRGDCEDYAFSKLARLLQAGFPGERMSVVRVVDETGAIHAVLLVDGELVLDNRFAWIERKQVLERYGYRFST